MQADNPISAEVDQAVRSAITNVVMRHLKPGADTQHVVTSAWTGALFAAAHMVWRFKGETSLEALADATREMTLSALHQVDVYEAGGGLSQ